MVNGKQIAAARTWLGISQAELGIAAEVATRTIAHLELGGRIPHDRTLKALVDALRSMGVEFIMDEKDVGVGIRMGEIRISQAILDHRQRKQLRGQDRRAG